MKKAFMKIPASCFLGLVISLLAAGAAAQTSDAQPTPASSTQVQQLQQEIDELRTELAALKQGSAAASGAASAPTPASDLITPASAAPAHTTLSSLLGPTTLSGFVDMYYGENFNHPANLTSGLRSFDGGANQFGLNMVELVIDKAPDAATSRTGYHIALGYGQAMNAINASDPGGLGFDQYLKEAYFSYLAPVAKGLQVDFGKFVTPAGAEVIETKDDWNYSRGILFSYAIPYYHFGLRAKYTFNDKYSLTGYVVNGWNDVVDNNSGKTYGASFGWNPTRTVAVAQTFFWGPETAGSNATPRQLYDTVVTFTPTPKLSLMANYDYGRGDRMTGIANPVWWSGIAGYVKYAVNSHYAVATRYEYYDDKYGFTTGAAQHINGITGTLERTIASRIIARLEFRRDQSTRPVFVRGNGFTDSQSTLSAGLVYVFDTKEGSN